jgi:hypothetical protein
MVLRGKVGIEDKVGVKKLNSKVCVVGEWNFLRLVINLNCSIKNFKIVLMHKIVYIILKSSEFQINN